LKWMQNRITGKTLSFIVIIQVAINIALLCARADTLGVCDTRQLAAEADAHPQAVIVSKIDSIEKQSI